MRNLFFFSLVLLAFFSCKKDDTNDNDNQNNPTYDNYFPLKIGNYWVYQYNKLDTNGNETLLQIIDSNWVDRDTIINNHTYFIIGGSSFGYTNPDGINYMIRDSNGHFVNQYGQILLSATNFSTKFNLNSIYTGTDTLVDLYDQMFKTTNLVNVPAGDFNVINKRTTITYRQKVPGVDSIRYSHSYFSKNVGNIYSTILFYSNPTIYEKKLLRYKIN